MPSLPEITATRHFSMELFRYEVIISFMESPYHKKKYNSWRKWHEDKAHENVQALILNPISKDFFMNSLKTLSRQHYEDVTVERSLSNICGYCLCDKELPPVPRQTHKIVKNRVYDLSVRKRFCSNRCYTISCKISQQIPSTPLWLRVHGNMAEIDISFDHEGGALGEEVLMQPNISRLEYLDQDYVLELGCPREDVESIDIPLGIEALPPSTTAKGVGAQQGVILYHKAEKGVYAEKVLIEGQFVLRQWITQSTLEFLFGCGDSIVPKSRVSVDLPMGKHDITQSALTTSKPQTSLEMKSLEHDLTYEESDCQYVDRVSNFFGNRSALANDSQEQPSISTVLDHQSEARYVRENIVMKQVQKLLDDLSPPLPNVVSELKAFVKTLNLTKLNVVLHVELWPMLTISILYLLSLKNSALENILSSDEFSKVLQKILQVYGTNMSSLKQIVLEVPILQKYYALVSK